MPPQLKFLSVIMIWGMATAITILQLVINDGTNFNWLFSAVLFLMAAAATNNIMGDEDKKKSDTLAETHANGDKSTADKRKNDQSGGLDPLSLLTPDDLEDLRQEVKDRLRERMLSGEDGELSSLDSLLADQHKRK